MSIFKFRRVMYLWKPSTILRWLQRSFLVRCSNIRASTRHSMNVLRYWGRPRLGSHSLPSHSWLISPYARLYRTTHRYSETDRQTDRQTDRRTNEDNWVNSRAPTLLLTKNCRVNQGHNTRQQFPHSKSVTSWCGKSKVHRVSRIVSFHKFHYNDLLPTCCGLVINTANCLNTLR